MPGGSWYCGCGTDKGPRGTTKSLASAFREIDRVCLVCLVPLSLGAATT